MSPTESTLSPRSRRALLAAVGTATFGGLAGCLDEVGKSADRDGPPPSDADIGSSSANSSPDESAGRTDDDSPTQFQLTHVEPADVDAPVVVYPTQLRTWLRDAAGSEEPIRVHASAPVYAPTPMLTALSAVELPADEAGEGARQTYEIRGEGGTRYDLLVGAKPVESVPDDADPTPVADLSEGRRDLVRGAISDQSRARVVPETRLGEWVRTDFFDGYVERQGTVYRGHEIQQTDAAFFSKEFWLVVSLVPVPASETPTPTLGLAFPEVPEAVRSAVDPVLSESKQSTSVTTATVEDDSILREFAEEYDYLLTHTALFEIGRET
ncbi:hypothetical protein [Salinirubrum litoreum]|uniref:DUF7979 domain-containing protein n=1 Tax=Salinirubrum litoreum TaxID=1126234 RepID=A0ABD5R936_9EURY|nr:hypothetical protein [Salinirubrum litoreum]